MRELSRVGERDDAPLTPDEAARILAALAQVSGSDTDLVGMDDAAALASAFLFPAGERSGAAPGLAEARYQALVEQIPAVTFMASLAGAENDLYVSPQIESLLGFTQEEWLSDPILWYHQIHPEDREPLSQAFADACLTGQPFRGVVRVYTRDRDLRWVHAEARFVRDEHGRLLFLQGVGFDITEQHRAEETRQRLFQEMLARQEAEEALRLREDFISVAAHELRNPVNSLRLSLQAVGVMAGKSTPLPEPLGRVLGLARDQTDRLTLLVENLLDVSRITAGRLELQIDQVDLTALVRRQVEQAVRESEQQEITVHAPVPVVGAWDKLRLEQVMTNLLSNAIKYGEGKPIDIVVERQGGDATLRVRDRGIGLTAEQHGRIFDKFERAASLRQYGGMGLGLWITRQLVEAHSGAISVTSVPGEGSEFTVQLPLGGPPA